MTVPEMRDGVEVETPVGKFRARGTDTIQVLVALMIAAMCAILYIHLDDAKKTGDAVATTNKEVAAALKESNVGFTKSLQDIVRSQNLATCILATDQDKREKEYMKPDSFCNRVSQ